VEVVEKSSKGSAPPKRSPTRGFGGSPQSTSPRSRDQYRGECFACRCLGKEFMHDFRTCPDLLKSHPEGIQRSPRKFRESGDCWTCQRLGKPSKHNYRDCAEWLAQYPSQPKSPESPIPKDHPKVEDKNSKEEPKQKEPPKSKPTPK